MTIMGADNEDVVWQQQMLIMCNLQHAKGHYGEAGRLGNPRKQFTFGFRIKAIKNKSFHLGFGKGDIKLSNLAYANANRDCRIFE